jgi:hypothetical protein
MVNMASRRFDHPASFELFVQVAAVVVVMSGVKDDGV